MVTFMLIQTVIGILAGLYIFFYSRRILRFWGMGKTRRAKALANIISVAAGLMVFQLMGNLWGIYPVIILHIIIPSLGFDLLAGIISLGAKIINKQVPDKVSAIYRCGLIPMLIAVSLIAYGTKNMESYVETDYTLTTDKSIDDYTIVVISDTHYDTVQDPKLLEDAVEKINRKHPDLVILDGDIVEERTSNESMHRVFSLLGGIQSTYGTYYIYGNHDKQTYTDSPSYTETELAKTIEKNGIRILKDSYAEIGDDLILVGRDDAKWGNTSGRAEISTIVKDVDKGKYIVVADHQPIEVELEEQAGVDLLVSGHTHAGQIWPIGLINEWLGTYNYGQYQKGNLTVLVTSGFTGWGYPIRTQKHCEYVCVHIEKKEG